jgi:hypothetical protein
LKPLDNVTLDEDDSDVDNFQPDQRGEWCDSDPTFEQSGPLPKSLLTTEAVFNGLVLA